MKICCKCKKEKDLSEFGKLKNSIDGYRLDCKLCRKEYYYSNHNKMLTQRKDSHKKHRDKQNEKALEYYKDNKESILDYRHKYYDENKIQIREKENQKYYSNLEENRAKKRENEAKRRLKKQEWLKNNLITVEYPNNYKICTKCQSLKEINYFNKRRAFCKDCESNANKEYRLNNLEILREKDRKNSQSEEFKQRRNEWRKARRNTPEFLAEYNKPENRLIRNMTQYIRFALNNYDLKKNGQETMKYLNCGREFFYKYIELQFEPGMTWKNYGNKENCWSLDHYIPKEAFNLNIPEEQNACFNWSNCRPLWHSQNESKADLMPDGTRASITKNNYTLDNKIDMILQRLKNLNLWSII